MNYLTFHTYRKKRTFCFAYLIKQWISLLFLEKDSLDYLEVFLEGGFYVYYYEHVFISNILLRNSGSDSFLVGSAYHY